MESYVHENVPSDELGQFQIILSLEVEECCTNVVVTHILYSILPLNADKLLFLHYHHPVSYITGQSYTIMTP